MKSPFKIFAIVAIVIGCALIDVQYHLMPWWEKEPVAAPSDTTATTWVSGDTLQNDTLKKDSIQKTESKIIK